MSTDSNDGAAIVKEAICLDHENGSNGGAGNKQRQADDEDRKLFLGGLSWDTNEDDVRTHFGKYGTVIDVSIKFDAVTGNPRGFGFITFAEDNAIDKVLAAIPHSLKNKVIDPKRAKSRPICKKIFVGGIDANIPEDDIKKYFAKYGKVEGIELPFDRQRGRRREFCFIIFDTEDGADNSCKEAKQNIGGRDCDIKKAQPQPVAQQQKRMQQASQHGGGGGGYGGYEDGGWSEGGNRNKSRRGGGHGGGHGAGGASAEGGNWGGYGNGANYGYGGNQAYYGNYGYGSQAAASGQQQAYYDYYNQYGGYGAGYGGDYWNYPGYGYGGESGTGTEYSQANGEGVTPGLGGGPPAAYGGGSGQSSQSSLGGGATGKVGPRKAANAAPGYHPYRANAASSH